MAIVEQAAAPPKGPSLVIQCAVLLVLTLAAAGGGWFAGNYLGQESADGAATDAAAGPAPAADHGAPAAGGHDGVEGEHGDGAPANPLLVPLAPMTTNLAAPSKVWMRLELALLLDTPLPPEVIETIHQDLFAYVRTLKLHQIEGASGYLHLRADLEERARIRGDDHVKQVLIRTLLFE